MSEIAESTFKNSLRSDFRITKKTSRPVSVAGRNTPVITRLSSDNKMSDSGKNTRYHKYNRSKDKNIRFDYKSVFGKLKYAICSLISNKTENMIICFEYSNRGEIRLER